MIIAAKNCRIPATNHAGIVSTATRIAKNVVPQTMATVKIAKVSLKSFKISYCSGKDNLLFKNEALVFIVHFSINFKF
mgnify:CR=1 FL=1